MADVTLRLVWYRLGESYKNMADGLERLLDWYAEFSWRRIDLLDMLFLGWLLAAFLVVGALNLYLRFFGLPKSGRAINGDIGRPFGFATISGGETCQWVNSALSWLYLHYNSTPEVVEAWIRALNEQARKHSDGLQIKFERVQSGSTLPKVTRIATDPASKDNLSLRAGVEASDLTIVVSVIQNTPTNLKVTSCDVTLTRLKGQIHIRGNHSQDTIQVTLAFVAPPEVTLTVNTRNYDTSVDKTEVERLIKKSIGAATTSISLASKGSQLSYTTSNIQAEHSNVTGRIPPPVSIVSVDTDSTQCHRTGPPSAHTITATTTTTTATTPLTNNHQRPQIKLKVKSPLSAGRTTPQDRRLLVKIIKANGLSDKDFGCTNPYCVVSMDSPHQSHTTSVVKNTVNPFWDEHFIFDFDDLSKQIKFEVYDRERPSGEDFLGRATIAMDELRRLPSTRQIIPLIENPHATTTTSGSITIELQFVDSGEASRLSASSNNTDTISPRRRIETNTRITPGGAVVKMTTTTTEKPKDQRVEPFFNDAPHPVERPEGTTYQTDYSPYNSHGSHLEAHDAALSASPELENGTENIIDVALRELKADQTAPHKHTPSKTSTIIITGVQKDNYTIPLIKMHEAGTQGDKPGGPETLNLQATVNIDSKDVKTQSLDRRTLNKMKKAHQHDKKKSSFANTLKKRFSRPKKRSQSADRAYSSSFKESSLLKPPEHPDTGTQSRTAEDVDGVGLQEGNLRKARSQSFSSSLRRLFKKKKKEGASRESSISRGGASGQASREGSVSHPSPHLSYRDDLQDYTHEYSYSSSMPASASPLSHPH